ncbi:sugar kinase [Domibacillus indicus]|uniref:sugar kinase n=1 Tax=Domibacillus indicus TaxID=1437523 RepID=UPI002040AE6D|nr:sugar kinase [Domibacillus indicus]MCM3787292.1 sugar kinase [Domibacillus indicus]
MTTIEVVTFGEAMSMFMAKTPGPLHEVTEFTQALAGAETNTAIGLARLGFKSGWASKVGKDAFGAFILAALAREGVNTDHVWMEEQYPTGFQFKSKVTEGDPHVQYHRKGSAASRLTEEEMNPDYFLQARHLHMTGIPLALSLKMRAFSLSILSTMKKAGKTISFDPNLRPSLWASAEEMIGVTNEAAYQADIVLPGIEEGEQLTGYTKPDKIADFYRKRGVPCVIVKLGSEGAYIKTAAQEAVVPGYKVEQIVDTVGAGDGFAAGVIGGLLEGLPIEECARRGNAIGAMAVGHAGDHEGYPDRLTLARFMNKFEKEVAYNENTAR